MSILNTSINRNLITNEPEDWNGYSLEELQNPFSNNPTITFNITIDNLKRYSTDAGNAGVNYRFSEKSVLTIKNFQCNVPHINKILLYIVATASFATLSSSSRGTEKYPFLGYMYIENPYMLPLKATSGYLAAAQANQLSYKLTESDVSYKNLTLLGQDPNGRSNGILYAAPVSGGNIPESFSNSCIALENCTLTPYPINGVYYFKNYFFKKYAFSLRMDTIYTSKTYNSAWLNNLFSVQYSTSFVFRSSL